VNDLDAVAAAVADESGEVDIIMDPMLIRSSIDEAGNISTQAFEIPQLFAEANDYLNAQDYANALRLYDMILDSSVDDHWRQVTLYNSSMALEGLGDVNSAVEQYETIVRDWPHSEDARWACFRLAEIAATQGRYADVLPWMDHVVAYAQIPVADQVEAHVRSGFANLELRRFDEAISHFNLALRTNEQARVTWTADQDRAYRALPANDTLIAQSHYGIGRVYHQLFSQIRLVLPREALERDLVDKAHLLETAEASYLNAVRTGHPYWGPAGGYMVAQMYEGFYFDILATEVEPDFNELELDVYFELVREQIQPAIDRALSIYESNLAMCYRMGADNEWTDATLERLQYLQNYLYTQQGWADEHQLVIEQRHPNSARIGDGMHFRSEEAAHSPQSSLMDSERR
jgi:tetratricopeptide (TPR) repeat protein